MKKSATPQGTTNLKVTVFWGDILYDTALCRSSESVTVGRGPENTFIVDLDRTTNHSSIKLAELQKDHTADFYFDDEMDGHLRFGSELLSFQNAKKSSRVSKSADGRYHARLSRADKADVIIGHMSFYFDWSQGAVPVPFNENFNLKKLKIASGLVLLFIALVLIVQNITVEEVAKPPERLVTILSKPIPAPAKAAIGATKSADGGAAKGELGKAELAPPEKPSVAASLQKMNLGSIVSGLTSLGSNNTVSKTDRPSTQAAIQQTGTGGFSTTGLKAGGGGHSIGIGRSVGRGEGGFEGTGRLGLSGNSALEGGDGYGDGSIATTGGLPRDVIESVIRRRLDRIRLCYERQLNFHAKLRGKISVHFDIGASGQVLSSQIAEDTMKNERVASCIQSEVKSWTFPAPEGGTRVQVDYPFVFESNTAE